MSMTDLEICKRIAEIEGEFTKCEDWSVNMCAQLEFGDGANWKIYSPLKDKALCFELMVKHNVRVEPSDCNAWIDNEDGYPEHEVIHHDGTLQQAICLAIIEAKGGS